MTSEEFRTDPMFLRNQFDSNGIFEIPLIRKDEINLDDVELIGYDKLCNQEYEKIVHFFLDDYKFEVLWRDPEPRIERLRKYKAVLSPNYSLYTEMPLSLKIYNTFRSRWCGAYLQSKGITVVPRVTGIIRTRLKTAIFKPFRHFGFKRRQPSCILNTKNPIKISRFKVEDFLQCRFLARQGTKRSKSLRICEYFNDGLAEISL